MSTTTMTLSLTAHDADSSASCPHCGHDTGGSSRMDSEALRVEEAQRMIEDLQAQVRLLTQKATAAVDKWADYEDELRTLRAAQQQQQQQLSQPSPSPTPQPQPTDLSPPSAQNPSRPTTPQTGYVPMSNRLSSFLTARKSTPNLLSTAYGQIVSPPKSPQPPLPPTPSERELSSQLEAERRKRQQAEGKLDEASGELEELSAQLFQQANEMVAQERKARAKLEQRVEVLERRDGEKRKRLERLEGAMGRIERVRGLLGEVGRR